MKQGHNYYVYILKCSDGRYYTGVTNDLQLRLNQHNNGEDKTSYTYSRRPVEIKYYVHYTDINQAIRWEKQIQKWTRKKKQALIDGDWEELVHLSNSSKNKIKTTAAWFDRLTMTAQGRY